MEFIDNLINELSPIRDIAMRLIGADPNYVSNNGVLSISKKPRIGSEAYALNLFDLEL